MSEGQRSPWFAAIVGGLIGSAVTGAVLVTAGPQLFGERLVRGTMLSHPDILVQAADALREQQFAPVLESNRAALETPFGSSWEGAKDADVVLVEFYDYACPYCKASNPVVDRLIKEEPGLRVVYRELPVLGPASVAAARVSLAASKDGKFSRFHDAMYEAGRPSEETIAAAAQAVGLPQQVPDSPDIEAELRRNFQLAGQLGATGTPLFVVGNRVLNGAVGYDALKKAIVDARSN